MKTGNGRFVDTNVLVYAAQAMDVRYAACITVLTKSDGPPIYISQQIVAEFYSTITSLKRVTVPLTSAEAVAFIETLLAAQHIILLPISTDVSAAWLALLKRHEVRGPRTFDFQIAATMLAHGVTQLITYNGADFKNIEEIEVLEPEPATSTQ